MNSVWEQVNLCQSIRKGLFVVEVTSLEDSVALNSVTATPGGCSHSRSHDYWIESINGSPGFTAAACSMPGLAAGSCNTCSGGSCVQMGFHSSSRYLKSAPFLNIF